MISSAHRSGHRPPVCSRWCSAEKLRHATSACHREHEHFPYIGVIGTHDVPELSRLIGSAMSKKDCIDICILCSPCASCSYSSCLMASHRLDLRGRFRVFLLSEARVSSRISDNFPGDPSPRRDASRTCTFAFSPALLPRRREANAAALDRDPSVGRSSRSFRVRLPQPELRFVFACRMLELI